jgi:hypothetical protein
MCAQIVCPNRQQADLTIIKTHKRHGMMVGHDRVHTSALWAKAPRIVWLVFRTVSRLYCVSILLRPPVGVSQKHTDASKAIRVMFFKVFN